LCRARGLSIWYTSKGKLDLTGYCFTEDRKVEEFNRIAIAIIFNNTLEDLRM
jgi:hypothetical protein